MGKEEADPSHLKDIPHVRKEERPDFSKPLPSSKLPEALQKELDDDERYWEIIYDGKGKETTDTNLRYAAYASRVRTILLSAHRYVAYTSDIGESFRPIAHPYMIKGAYAVSWLYLGGDVAHEGYKAYIRNQRVLNPMAYTDDKKTEPPPAETTLDPVKLSGNVTQREPGKVAAIDDYRAVMAQRAVFQGIASMGLPAFTIHSIVRYSGRALKNATNVTIRTYGPIGLGLAAVPALPFIFDKPVEHAVEYVFHKGFELVGGPSAVGGRPVTGPKELMAKDSTKGAVKEKEL